MRLGAVWLLLLTFFLVPVAAAQERVAHPDATKASPFLSGPLRLIGSDLGSVGKDVVWLWPNGDPGEPVEGPPIAEVTIPADESRTAVNLTLVASYAWGLVDSQSQDGLYMNLGYRLYIASSALPAPGYAMIGGWGAERGSPVLQPDVEYGRGFTGSEMLERRFLAEQLQTDPPGDSRELERLADQVLRSQITFTVRPVAYLTGIWMRVWVVRGLVVTGG